MTAFAKGQQARITGSFVALPSGEPADPDTVTLYVLSPSGEQMEFTTDDGVVREGPGIYHYDLVYDESGIWRRAWVGSGDIACAEVDQLDNVALTHVRS